ncbi:MAG: SMI1/KNR4 family protein [Prevotella sp.]|jgi:hypothetical protein|nr:SMI1/KNR4 family protein [Prevotella sp.]
MFHKQDILEKVAYLIAKRRESNSPLNLLQFNFINECLSDSSVCKFEKSNNIELPDDYRYFITEIGNGGIGPDYGILSLEESIIDFKLKNKPKIRLDKNFRFTDAWNEKWVNYFDWDNELPSLDLVNKYMGVEYINGSLQISHSGHGCTHLLIVNGSEKGFIWYDGRADYDGIYPESTANTKRISFEYWYSIWLEDELKKYGY